MIEYKGYIGHIEFDDEANIFHGEVVNTRDVITFQGSSIHELRKALCDSVEYYLQFCKKHNKQPDKPFSGKFIVRLSPEQHRKIFIAAHKAGESLNKWVTHVLEEGTRHAC
jgi:predicted HicB family RNase H-like nuclease